MNEELETLKVVTQRLAKASIRYMVTGSMASSFYSEPRMTRDLDIVVELDPAGVEKFVSLFVADCYIDAEVARSETARRGMFNIIDNARSVKVDFIVREDGEYARAAFERRRQLALEGGPVWVIAAEDLVLAKLMWAKPSRSELQLRDVGKILSSQPQLDMAYVRDWAGKLGVSELLAEVSHE